MIWKAIGSSVMGTSHISTNKPCEDAIQYKTVRDAGGDEVLICCASDGAGSAQHAAWAAAFTTDTVIHGLQSRAVSGSQITETDIYSIAEDIYDGLANEAIANGAELSEYSCTLLGCYITTGAAIFFQLGDGAIVRNDGSGFYIPIWWPDNGEYQNTTSFLVEDRSFGNLHIQVLEEQVQEVAIFTDGMQLLVLNTADQSAHQPFFENMFRHLRLADDAEKVNTLNKKLADYLNSAQINSRTDDDKTLFLATRL